MRKTKELDHHLKHIINQVPVKLEQFETSKEQQIGYYLGYWATDAPNNITEKQSEKIFKKMNKIMDNNPNVVYVQKRMKNIEIGTWSEYGEQAPQTITGYEYYAIKRQYGQKI